MDCSGAAEMIRERFSLGHEEMECTHSYPNNLNRLGMR